MRDHVVDFAASAITPAALVVAFEQVIGHSVQHDLRRLGPGGSHIMAASSVGIHAFLGLTQPPD
ncbi:MAG TPA: hypothetical protein VJX16_29045 [Terriglobales bacterium]|nr:hypothetical protein [Terriglobales bacterium]